MRKGGQLVHHFGRRSILFPMIPFPSSSIRVDELKQSTIRSLSLTIRSLHLSKQPWGRLSSVGDSRSVKQHHQSHQWSAIRSNPCCLYLRLLNRFSFLSLFFLFFVIFSFYSLFSLTSFYNSVFILHI